MKNEKTKIWPSTLEEAYKAREPHYLVCFREECPLRSSCLHYACGEFVDKEYYFVEAVNPKYPKVATSECPIYRKNETRMMKTGLTKFYKKMTGEQERAVRAKLISHYNKKVYYWLRNGEKTITPEDQQFIEDVCRQHGYRPRTSSSSKTSVASTATTAPSSTTRSIRNGCGKRCLGEI